MPVACARLAKGAITGIGFVSCRQELADGRRI